MKEDYHDYSTLPTQPSSTARKFVIPNSSHIAKHYQTLTQEITKQHRVLFRKKLTETSPKHEQESFEIKKELYTQEICDWGRFMQKDHEIIEEFNNQSPKSKFKGDRYNYFYKMQLGNKYLAQFSTQDFMKTIRYSNQLNDYAKLYQQEPQNLYLSLNYTQQQKVPKTFGLVQNTRQIVTANASRSVRSTEDCKAFSSALLTKQTRQLTQLQLNEGIFNPKQLKDILISFPITLKDVELQNCKLNYKHMDILMPFINKNQIYKLNLEQNNIRDLGCQIIMKYLMINNTLQYLNLNNNQITEMACQSISNLLKQTQRLTELYLGYNNLNGSAGSTIWKAMYKNTSIKILDMAHNNISSLECAQSISKAVARPYNELVHIDLSFNHFTYVDAQIIAEGLQKNETIYGFHFEGNQIDLQVNQCGFLINKAQQKKDLQNKLNDLYKQPQYFKLIEGELEIQRGTFENQQQFNTIPISRQQSIRSTCKNKKLLTEKQFATCWICQGWQEIKFEWTAHKSGSLYNEPIFIHFDFEDYRPLLMTFLNNEFFLFKMCPANSVIHYFFTNPILGVQQPAMDQNIKQKQISSIPFLYNDEYLVDGNQIDQVNYLITSDNQQLFDKYMPLVQCKPREIPAKFDFSKYLNIKKNCWSIENSIFKYFQPDTPQLIDECFEFDFKNSKVARLAPQTESIQDIKNQLQIAYKSLFNIYKYFASGSFGIQIPCITIIDYIDFLVQSSLMDGLKSNDIDISFTSTSGAKDVQFPQAYEKGLVRCQLLEIMIRLCNDKFLRTGLSTTMNDAIKLLQVNLEIYANKFDDSQMWRKSRLWNQKCDIILQDRLAFLKALFKFVSKITKKDKQQYKYEFISSQDFKDFCNQSKLISDELNERECYLLFLQSMITQQDELFSSKHYQMNLHEFIEALGRLAEKLSIIRGDKELDIDDRRAQELNNKLNGLLLFIYLVLGNDIKTVLQPYEIKQMDKCMINDFKSLKQKLEDSFTDGDEPPYDPKVELPHLQSQITYINVNNSTKKQSLRQQIKQVKREENKFSLINFVQYFKSIKQVYNDDD